MTGRDVLDSNSLLAAVSNAPPSMGIVGEEPDIGKSTPNDLLAHASRAGLPAEVRSLIEFEGADVNCRSDGLTPLMLATMADGHTPISNDDSQPRRKKIVETLLERHADVNAVNIQGWTPLFFATFYAQHDVVPLLIQYNANVQHRDKTGRDASAWLRWSEPDREKQKPILKMFYELGLVTPVFQLVKQQRLANEFFCPMGLDAASRKTAEKIPDLKKLNKKLQKDRQQQSKENAARKLK